MSKNNVCTGPLATRTCVDIAGALAADSTFTKYVKTEDLDVHVIDMSNFPQHEAALEALNICQAPLVSKSYEQLIYSTLDNENLIGVFLYDPKSKSTLVSFVINMHVEHTTGLTPQMFNSREKYLEVMLLCSNPQVRRAGAASALFAAVTGALKRTTRRGILLWIANPDINTSARKFYEKFGFKPVNTERNSPLLLGGKKRKSRRKM